MKKIFYFGTMVITLFILSACSTNTPSEAMMQYFKDLQNGNYEEFVEGMGFSGNLSPEEIKEMREGWVSILKEKAEKEFEEKGGLKSFEIISEEISEDGNKAVVKFKQVYGNGEESEEEQEMTKKDGKWLMDSVK